MKLKWYLLIVTVALIRLSGVHSQPPTPVTPEILCKHFLYGYPLGTPPSNDLIIRDCCALNSDATTKFADWVCCYLTCHEVDGDLDLERNWRNDPWLDPSETALEFYSQVDEHHEKKAAEAIQQMLESGGESKKTDAGLTPEGISTPTEGDQ